MMAVMMGFAMAGCATSEDIHTPYLLDAGSEMDGGTDVESGVDVSVDLPAERDATAGGDAMDGMVEADGAKPMAKCSDVPGGTCDWAGNCGVPTDEKGPVHWSEFDGDCAIAEWCCGQTDCPAPGGCYGACQGLFKTEVAGFHCSAYHCCQP